MGCSSSKVAKKFVAITPDVMQKMSNTAEGQRPVSLYPHQEFRLTKIDWEEIVKHGEPWIDTYFRPEQSSILDVNVPTVGRLKEWETYVWKRPKDVYGKDNFSIFRNISPQDIKQGACGDCYFLSSISSLAENPDRIKELFLNPEVNKAGCYAIQLYVLGEPQVVVVDDYFPFNEKKNVWAFSRSSSEKEIWVLLLEKAWAKVNGSYQRIEGGTTGEALPALTGAPSDFFYHSEVKNQEEIWKKIREADQKNYIIATAVSSLKQGKSSAEMQRVGLIDAHAYSLISSHEVTDNEGKKVRLLKIRNPWGFKEWTGDWSDKSTKWTTDIKDELGFENKDDGIFYISFEDYVKFFYITTICKDIYENDLSVMPDEHEKNEYCVQKFTVPKDQENIVGIIVHQLHARIADVQIKGQYRYAPMKLIVTKLCKPDQNNSKNTLLFIDGQYICYQHANIELPRLTAGEYIIFFKAEWMDKVHVERRLVLNIYAPDPFKIERISSKAFNYEYIGELEDMLADRIDQGFSYQRPEF